MQWLHDQMMREDDPVSVFLVRLILGLALVWLTAHGTMNIQAAVRG